LFVYFSAVRPDVNLRIVIASTVVAFCSLRITRLGFRGFGTCCGSRRNWLLILSCLVAGVWFAMRAFATLLFERQITDFMAAGTLHGLSILIYSLASLLIMTDLMMVNRRKVEQQLIAEEKRYRLLFSQSPVGVVQIDRRGRIVEINEAFARIIGTPMERLIGLDTLAALKDPRMITAVRTALEGKSGQLEGTFTSVVTGSQSYLQVLTRGIQAADGTVAGAIGIFQDITERKRAEEALQNQERLRGALELAGAVCHEMNQPLMAIQGYADLIRLDAADAPPALAERLAKIVRQIDRLKTIGERLMGITRYETKPLREGQIFDLEKGSAPPPAP
jgi:PAS domain S-box-containing protein